MDDKLFYNDRNIKNLQKIEGLLAELPPFVEEYFIGIENQTSTLTRLNYAYDLRIFSTTSSKSADLPSPSPCSRCAIWSASAPRTSKSF